MAKSPAPKSVDASLAEKLYLQMCRMRALESSLTQLSQSGDLRGSLHLAMGQEALPAGACAALRPDDSITVTYRGHGYVIAKGCDLTAVVSEILGRKTGLCKGKGGKMHLTDLSRGLLGANGIVGGGVGTAVGAALASWMDGADRVSMAVFGDGTLNQGHVHECLNMAGLYRLPVIFLCENNDFAEMTALRDSTAVTDLCVKMAAYGIPAQRIDGNDAFEVYGAVSRAVERARTGQGPLFIEAITYRTCGHYQNDPGTSYRSRSEIKAWEARSPFVRFANDSGFSKAKLDSIDQAARREVAEAVAKAMAAPFPEESELYEGVFL